MQIEKIKCRLVAALLAITVLVISLAMPASAADSQTVPDLTVTGVNSVENELYDGDNITITAVVRNSSNIDVNSQFTVDFAIDGQFLQTVICKNGLKAGKVTSVSTNAEYILFGGSHRVTAYVNVGKKISETNYNNNILKERIDVSMEPNPGQNPSTEPVQPTTIDTSNGLPVEASPVFLPEVKVFQAESTTLLSGTSSDHSNAGYKGSAYVPIRSDNQGFMFTFNAPEAGNYIVKVRYATFNDSGRISYTVNDGGNNGIDFDKQERIDSWKEKSITIHLEKGSNTFKFFAAPGDRKNVMIDQVSFEKDTDKYAKEFRFLRKDNPSLPCDINCDIGRGKITAYIPSDLDVSDLVASYSTDCNSVKVKGVEQKSGVTHNNFVNGHYYTFTSGGNSITYAVKFIRLNDKNIPSFYINFGDDATADEINMIKNSYNSADKQRAVSCTYTLSAGSNLKLPDTNGNEINTFSEVTGTVSLRGNSTLGTPKKPYKVKFEKKNAVLDMEKSKSWVLIACYGDKSFMRDYIGYQLGQTLDKMGYSPDMRYVNLFLDGSYNGLYLIGEGAKIGKGRLDMTEIDEKSTDITGGYILEHDRREYNDSDKTMFKFNINGEDFCFTIKEPDEEFITNEVKNYIKDYVGKALNSMINGWQNHEYEQYIDVDSFVDWYIAMELTKVHDASGLTSIYLHKDVNGKLCMGPVWDFIPGSGLIDYSNAIDGNGNIVSGSIADSSGYWIKNSIWWRYLFQDQQFVNKVKARWQELYATGFDGILNKIDRAEQYIKSAASDNFVKWDILDKYIWAEPFVMHTHEAYVKQYRDWMEARVKWLNEQYGK